MRSVLSTCLLLVIWSSAFALPSTTTIKQEIITVTDISQMSVKEYQRAVGHKLSLKEKIVYGLAKKQIKKGLKGGTIPADAPAASRMDDVNFGAFLLGLFLGIIGILLVFLLFDDQDAWKSALLGLGIWLLILLLLL